MGACRTLQCQLPEQRIPARDVQCHAAGKIAQAELVYDKTKNGCNTLPAQQCQTGSVLRVFSDCLYVRLQPPLVVQTYMQVTM